MTGWRLMMDDPAPGVWNMAVDEALLHSALQGGPPTLRFYQWSEPTLSLGYFQAYADRQLHAPSYRCSAVRRASGGGAILHDDELTYSLVLPIVDRWSGRATDLYQGAHGALVWALAARGVDASLRGDHNAAHRENTFLCFLRHAAGDVLLGGVKIAGSAQRRVQGAVLQHGSVLLGSSECAPELPGIEELTGRRLDRGELAGGWSERFAEEFQVVLASGRWMTASERWPKGLPNSDLAKLAGPTAAEGGSQL